MLSHDRALSKSNALQFCRVLDYLHILIAGCALLSFDPYQMPAIQPVPLLLPSVSDLDSPLDAPVLEAGPAFDTGFKGASYLMVHAAQLWHIQYK